MNKKETVIIVPGNFASTLVNYGSHNPGLIWINPFALALGRFGDLALAFYTDSAGEKDLNPDVKIQAVGFAPFLYNFLEKAISRDGFDVVQCPYDWRRDIDNYLVSGDLLNLLLRLIPLGKVHIITHSEGSMVARRAIQDLAVKIGQQAVMNGIGNLILLGPSSNGTMSAALALAGAEKQLPILAAMPTLGQNLQVTLKTFTSLYQLLPWNSSVVRSLTVNDVRQFGFWNGLVELTRLQRAFPANSPAWASTVDTQFLSDKTTVVMGDTGPTTPNGVMFENGNMVIDHRYDAQGDGFMAHVCSTLPNTKAYVSSGTEHLMLPIAKPVINGIIAILNGKIPSSLTVY